MKRTLKLIGGGKFGLITKVIRRLKDSKTRTEFTKEYIIKTFKTEEDLNKSLEIYNQLKYYAYIRDRIPKFYKKINSKQVVMPSLSDGKTNFCVSASNQDSNDFKTLKSL